MSKIGIKDKGNFSWELTFSVLTCRELCFCGVGVGMCWTYWGDIVITKQLLESMPSLPHPLPPLSRMRKHQNLAGDTGRIADPSWPQGRDVPCDVMLGTESWRKEEKGWDNQRGYCYTWWSPTVPRMADTSLPMGSSKSLVLLCVCTQLLLPY